MSCNSANCQSGSCGNEFTGDEDDRKRIPLPENGEGSNHVSPRRGDSIAHGLCLKCKVNETIAATHPAVTGAGGDGGRFCADCFRSNLYGKFRFAVTSNAMISPSDNVLVAFSGGSSSRYFWIYVFVLCVFKYFLSLWYLEWADFEVVKQEECRFCKLGSRAWT